jgi:cysteine desulfurase/selenocysteine lyase
MAARGALKPLSDITSRRNDFPVLATRMNGKPLAYLDSASSAQKPRAVMEAMTRITEQGYSNIHRGLYDISQDLTRQFEEARARIACFINAPENTIVFTKNTTEAINLVASSWGQTFLKDGDEIILSALEHHANIVPWQLLKTRINIDIKIIPVLEDGTLDMGAYTKLLSPRTKLVAVTHISNALGTINPVEKIITQARAYNPDIKILLDGSQAVVHGTVDVQHLGCDFYVFTGHKLYGPTGIGVLYGRYDVLESMPPYQGGGDMIERVTFQKSTFKKPPARFEAGTPAILEVIGLAAALDYMDSIGLDAIAAHEQQLLEYMTASLSQIEGLRIFGPSHDKAGIVSFNMKEAHTSDIAQVLNQMGVAVRSGHHCCMPLMEMMGVDSTVRASLGLYSNQSDIDQLAEGLRKVKTLFA